MFYFTFKPCFRNLPFRNIPQHDLDSTLRNCLCQYLYFFSLSPFLILNDLFHNIHQSPTLTCVVTPHVHSLLGKPHVVVPRILVKLRTNQTQTKINQQQEPWQWTMAPTGSGSKWQNCDRKSSNDDILILPFCILNSTQRPNEPEMRREMLVQMFGRYKLTIPVEVDFSLANQPQPHNLID